jgi:enoyl-CoA hydratase/carnithine racemase
MSSGKVTYERRGRTALVTLNRPEVRNAIDPEMDAELALLWAQFRDDEGADVAVLTGAGDAFCSGADRDTWFGQWIGAGAPEVRRHAEGVGFGGLTRGIDGLDKPVIAAINGWVLGGALELALASDIRIASTRAMFGLPLVRFGFHTGDGGLARLGAICGIGVALDLALTAEPIDAGRALASNLVTRLSEPDELLDDAFALADQVASNDQVAVRSAKRTAHALVGRPLEEQLFREAIAGYSVGPAVDFATPAESREG